MLVHSKTTSAAELTAILLARLGFLWLLVFISLLLPNDDAAFYAFMGVAFIITIPYSLWLLTIPDYSRNHQWRILMDRRRRHIHSK